MSVPVYIALGSNLGDKSANLRTAREAIARIVGTRVVAESSIEETEPVGPVHQPTYLNQMLAVETSLAPEQMLDELQAIERQCGRTRGERWGPRTLDLDIVRFAGQTINTPSLAIPHPEIANRDFWQREIAELEGIIGE